MRSIWAFAPIIVAALWVALRALRGRRMSREGLSLVVSLLLLAYLLGTAAAGVFWVSRLQLPRFDLHYLLGYCLLLLATVHVALQLGTIGAQLRVRAPRRLLSPDGRQFRPAARLVAVLVAASAACVPLVWLGSSEEPVVPARLVHGSPSATPSSSQEEPKLWIERGGARLSALAYLHEQSSITRTGLLRKLQMSLGAAPQPCLEYPGAARTALPAPAGHAGLSLDEAMQQAATQPSSLAKAAVRSELGIDQLSGLVYYASGVTSSRAAASGLWLRAAPSAGALYPSDLYVAVRRVATVAPGLYYYHPHEHALIRIGDEARVDQIAASVTGSELVREAPVTFVLGATFARTASRYRSRAYRYVLLDVGHLAANLKLAGAAFGQQCELEPLFDDGGLQQALSLGTHSPAMLLVLPCARNRSGSVATAERVVWVPAHAELPMPADPDSQELCQLAHRLTSWRLVEGPAQAWTGQPASVPEAAAAMRLPAPVASAGDLFEVIRARRSYRDFSRRPVPAEEFSGLLHESFGLAPQVRGPRLLDFYVAVRSVLGIEPGLYQYLSASNSLRLVRRGSVAAALETAGLSQQVLGRAAFVLIWAMRTKRAEGIDGARGYRHVLLDAGLSGEHAYLSAVARGLGVCGIGAFHDTAVNELLRGQQQHVAALYLLGVGHRH